MVEKGRRKLNWDVGRVALKAVRDCPLVPIIATAMIKVNRIDRLA